MSEFKMSDVFVLPVSSNNGDLFNSKNPIGDTRICKFYNMNQFKASKAAAHAINSHDKLVEQVKLLREALVRVSEWDNMSQEFRLDNGSRGQQRVIVGIAEKALEATK